MAAALGSHAARPKLLSPLAGQPLARYAAAALASAGDPVRLAVVPPGPVGAELRGALAGLGYTFVINPTPELGLLTSFQVAVQALGPEGCGLSGAVFALADMPLVSRTTHRALREADISAAAVQCRYGPVSAPPLRLSAGLFGPLLGLPPMDAGPRELLRAAGALTCPCPPHELLDVDTPSALATAAAALEGRRSGGG